MKVRLQCPCPEFQDETFYIIVETAHSLGRRVAAHAHGADGSNPREFLMLALAGLTPMESLVATTVNAADLLGLQDEIGTLEIGKQADIIATDSNPINDIGAMLDIVFVMKAGKRID